MITITSNASEVLKQIIIVLDKTLDSKELSRVAAAGIIADVHHRIHEEGLSADGTQIGTYTPGYMKVRTGNFQSKSVTRGKNKGNPRPAYNRTNDPKVILSLTRQMENDFSVQADSEGNYGLGFSNPDNFQKAIWNDTRYGKRIYALTEEETQKVDSVIQEHIDQEIRAFA